MKTTIIGAREWRLFFVVVLAAVAMGWAGCADEKRSSGGASKPLAPPSYQDPVAPAIPEPNTNASMSPLPYSGPAPIQYIGPETGPPH